MKADNFTCSLFSPSYKNWGRKKIKIKQRQKGSAVLSLLLIVKSGASASLSEMTGGPVAGGKMDLAAAVFGAAAWVQLLPTPAKLETSSGPWPTPLR